MRGSSSAGARRTRSRTAAAHLAVLGWALLSRATALQLYPRAAAAAVLHAAVLDHDAPAAPRPGGAASTGSTDAPPAAEQCFDWSWTHSVAGGAFAYPANERGPDGGWSRNAEPGDIIPLQCDSVICPNPEVLDCYMSDTNICAEDEWCRLEDHLKFGPFGMVHGQTPNNIAYQTCGELQRGNYTELFQQVCAGEPNWGPWLAVRGRCEKFRAEEESCNAQLSGLGPGAAFGPQYISGTDGRPPKPALVCGPGLVCTGDFQPLPHTCVKARPPDVCYQGPWWDSISWCKVGGATRNNFRGGLPRTELELIAPALMLQLPTEIFHNPEFPIFWQSRAADQARASIAAIVEQLWPERYKGITVFPLSTFPDPRLNTDSRVFSRAWNVTTAEAHKLYRQANKVWSLIHTLMSNTADPMSAASVDASRALAIWLRQHFMCTNCRGFWGNAVVNEYGLPPQSTSREAHVRWWHAAHNAVSEHTAATRGGHPWVYPRLPRDAFVQRFGQLNPKLACQNPFFLPFEDVQRMWTITDDTAAR